MSQARGNQPEAHKDIFVCPHCGVLAKQDWTNVGLLSEIVNSLLKDLYLEYRGRESSYIQEAVREFLGFLTQNLPNEVPRGFIPANLSFAKCQSCLSTTVWIETEMVYPRSFPFPEPNEDLNDGIKKLYREAANVYQDSPRASAALLRLCIEELCQQLGETGALNTCIGNLVKKGMSRQIQQALDYCRVIGNNAVHAGKIDLEEDPSKVSTLFDLVNDIAYEMITKPREMKRKYSSLPEGARKAIANRDKSTT